MAGGAFPPAILLGPCPLLLNQAVENGSTNHWLDVRVEQAPANRFAFGARVGVQRTGKPTLWQRVRTDGSYLSASDARLHFGLGASPGITGIDVEWPDGQRERWTHINADQGVRLRRGSGTAPPKE